MNPSRQVTLSPSVAARKLRGKPPRVHSRVWSGGSISNRTGAGQRGFAHLVGAKQGNGRELAEAAF